MREEKNLSSDSVVIPTTNRVLVSVITVVYNGENFIRCTIDSVVNQTYENIEYIIVDGGSTDNTLDIVKSYGTAISKVISETDEGIYDAMNKGIEMASGDLVCILNSDDWFETNAIELFVKAYQTRKSDFLIIVGDTNRIGENDEVLFTMKNSNRQLHDKIGYTMAVSHPSVCVSKSVYQEIYQGFDLRYKILADYDLIYKAAKNDIVEFIFLHQIVVNMREGGVSDSFNPKMIFRRTKERFLIRKGTQNSFLNLFYCLKFYSEEFLRQFLKKYFPSSPLLKNKRK